MNLHNGASLQPQKLVEVITRKVAAVLIGFCIASSVLASEDESIFYYQVYVLTIHYCEAPRGQTACVDESETYTFADPGDCLIVRNNLIKYYDSFSNVIMDPDKSKCEPQIKRAWWKDQTEALNDARSMLDSAKGMIIE